jgi:hypothetical protein
MDEAKGTRGGRLGSGFRGDDDLPYLTGQAKRLTNVTSQAAASPAFNVGQASRLINKLALLNGSYIRNAYDSVARLTGTWLKNSSHSTSRQNFHGITALPSSPPIACEKLFHRAC